ncbi:MULTISPECIES: AAA family ATPase [Acinetobacter]|uniref:AAA family ATPase n=1 Tax=Acinetobacter piscicola TaxID=2006115 RepID=A0A7S6VXI9_9GAMM|nr:MULTISPECIES: AAA family ATPase [Acinetobacter]QOW46728.1 AAA family ATPase [Acinetobacter piscicola]
MTIQSVMIQGFRSVRKLNLPLKQLNIISGANGCGKSNLYKAMRLLHEAANGRLSQAIAEEGGIQKVMWAGGHRVGDRAKDPKRMILAVDMQYYEYQIEIGFPEPLISLFALDPLVKKENIWLSGYQRRGMSELMQRVNQAAFLKNVEGEKMSYPMTLTQEDSIFGQLSDPHLYPEVSQVRESMKNWRFYHEFSVSTHSPMRIPQVGIRSPVLAHDGANLAAAFETLRERGQTETLYAILEKAFPNTQFYVEELGGRFQMMMKREGILRPLESAEFSDGTLRFLCLAVALLSPRPPNFMALNEPENSLHPELLPALAMLIAEASQFTQLWVTSHSSDLAKMIRQYREFQHIELGQKNGETVVTAVSG